MSEQGRLTLSSQYTLLMGSSSLTIILLSVKVFVQGTTGKGNMVDLKLVYPRSTRLTYTLVFLDVRVHT